MLRWVELATAAGGIFGYLRNSNLGWLLCLSSEAIQNASDNHAFQQMTQKGQMLHDHGDHHINVFSSDSYSKVQHKLTFKQYLPHVTRPQQANR